MHIRTTPIDGLLIIDSPSHRDERGFFRRTSDVKILAAAGIDVTQFKQESQSRSYQGVRRGLHGRIGAGEAKLVRCAHGAMLDAVVDGRPDSPTFGRSETFMLDDQIGSQLFIPRGLLHGFQALTSITDVVYRIDAFHDPAEDVTVDATDRDLAIAWPGTATFVSSRDRNGLSWTAYRDSVSP